MQPVSAAEFFHDLYSFSQRRTKKKIYIFNDSFGVSIKKNKFTLSC